MKARSLLLGLCTACLLSLASAFAHAQTIYGTWSSTTGNRFEIPNTGRWVFDIVLIRPNGAREVFQGRWVRGMMGTQFVYNYGQFRYTGTFSSVNPRVVRVVDQHGTTSWWKRSTYRSARMVFAGVWRSSSGNFFTVPATNQNFNMIATLTNGRKQVYYARWVPGMEGVQFQYGNPPLTVTYNRQYGKMRVVGSNGVVTWWTRVR